METKIERAYLEKNPIIHYTHLQILMSDLP